MNVTYDNYGNILTKGNHTYGYDNVLWKDRLTSFDGQSITYDAQGNPTSYLGHNLTWEKGRQLKSFDGNTYTYNSEGIRISKIVDNVRHDYLVDGAKILKETWNDNVLIPIYNNDQEVVGIYYNCTPYYFYKNLQGDVISIADNDGRAIVAYSYDAWGVCTVLHDNSGIGLANINPYRYRSYYYDTEIGMYYLQSRYYDPVVGRFINADEVSWAVADINTIEINVFIYCKNDCVNASDQLGYGAIETLLGILKTSIDALDNIIKMISNSFNKEVKKLSESIKLLTKKEKRRLSDILALQEETGKVSKRLGWIGHGITFLTLVIGFSVSYKTGGNIDHSIIELAIESFVALVEFGAGKVFELIAKFIPYIGAILSIIGGFVISLLLSNYFNDDRVQRIKLRFAGLVKNTRVSLSNWVTSAAKSLTA